MAITDYTLRIDNKFRCPTQASAGVRDKRQHTHTAMPWSATPYVMVEAFVGTHDDMVNRTSAHGYTAHVPEAPCMLGAGKAEQYRRAAVEVSWGRRRYQAMAKASLVVGLTVAALSCLPLLACVVGMKLGLAIGLTWPIALSVISTAYLAGAGGGLGYETAWYSRAKAKFGDLATLADGYDQLQRGLISEAQVNTCEAIVNRSFDQTDWALRQAAREYEAELAHRRPAAAEATEEQKAA